MSATFTSPTPTRTIMILLGLIVVFVLPYGFHIDIGPGPNGMMAITWEFPVGSSFMLFTALEYYIYYFYRFVVLYKIWKLLMGSTTPKRVILHATISESIPIIISVIAILFLREYIPIMIPLPFLLVYVLLIINYGKSRNSS